MPIRPIDESDVRRIVVEEVNQVRGTVERLAGQVRYLYSNGSGGPPGFLEVARAQDEKDRKNFTA